MLLYHNQLALLQTMEVEQAHLPALLENFGQQAAPQTVWLQRNQLTALPERFARLAALQTLDLHRNQLAALAESFGQLAALRQLTVATMLRARLRVHTFIRFWSRSTSAWAEPAH